MFRSGARVALRTSQSSLAPARTAGRRFLTTDPPHLKSRGWRNSALRWGIAIAGIYYYNTSPIFAEQPQHNLLNPNVDAMVEDREDSIINELTASSRAKSQKNASALQSAIEYSSQDVANQEASSKASQTTSVQVQGQAPTPAMEGAAELEEEAEGQAAFNPATGEINWDCPCLGGMAYGPCGPEFREAFSCFVYSTQEPKGMDCIDKFQGMQDCFRAHPEHYKGELEDDERLDAELAQEKEELQKEIAERRAAIEAQQAQSVNEKTTSISNSPNSTTENEKPVKEKKKAKKTKSIAKSVSESEASPQPEAKTTGHTPDGYSQEKESEHGVSSPVVRQPQTKKVSAEATPESESLVPKAAHDATDMSSGDTHSKAV